MENTIRHVLVGKTIDFPLMIGKTVKIGTKEMAIFKLENGDIRAIENRCPHKGGVLAEGIVGGEHVFCPLHDWKISIINGKVHAPDIGCVKTYPVEVQNDDVFILVS